MKWWGWGRRRGPTVRGPSAGSSVCTAKHAPKENPPMALSQSALSELLDAFRAGEGVDLVRESVRLVLQELIEVEATEQIGAGPLRAHRVADHRPQRHPSAAVDDPGRRHRAADPEAAQGVVLPVDPRAPPPHRPGAVRGGDGGLRPRRLHPRRSTTWSRRWASTSGISKSEVSRICAGLDEIVGAFRTRTLGSHRVPLRLPRRHLPPRPQPRLGQVVSDGRGGRHRHHRRRRAGDPRRRRRRQRGRGRSGAAS